MRAIASITATALAAVALAGCIPLRSTTSTQPPAATAEPAPVEVEPTPTPVADLCLEISEGALASLNSHMLYDVVVTRAAAVVLQPDEDGKAEWFVAGEMNGPGVEGDIGVWYTHNDPTAPGENAYNSVDALAATFSDYLQPEGARSGMLNSDDAIDCLD